ncbi:hypothetical protein NLU13_7101 [Sarocladium strictum]|uniref:Uncharacterized protein n=1 Tax=Sarocladium strictum TaxID=5046 RepID=A0AA39GEZ8_SARSR|nr:hypothetical protein NLU13_7101 [Sarocladium strictum]
MSSEESLPCGGKKWGFVAYDVADAPGCISLCRQRFLESLVTVTVTDLQDAHETFVHVCETLSVHRQHAAGDHPLWDLYCCDAQLCGVDNVEGLGEDPNINWIINTCSNIGYKSIKDPGPPDVTYQCPGRAVNGDSPQCLRLKKSPISTTTTTTTTSSLSIEAIAQDTTIPSMTPPRLLSDPTISSVTDPSLTASTSDQEQAPNRTDGTLSTGQKVAIAISVVVGIVLFVAAILYLLRKKITCSSNSRARSGQSTEDLPRSTSSNGAAEDASLIPPLRLSERRLLPSRPSTASGSPPASVHRAPGFPGSPLVCPTKAMLRPRREEMRKANQMNTTTTLLPPLTPSWAAESASVRSRTSSGTTGEGSTHSGRLLFPEPGEEGVPSSRHVRHPSRVHSLASPGPAPNKKLPPTPVESTHSSRALSPSRHGDAAIGIVGHNPPSGVTLTGPSRDLCELTEAYEREARNSAGSSSSWSGNGGGGGRPGTVSTPSRRTHAAGGKSVLGESDLQRLGGQY